MVSTYRPNKHMITIKSNSWCSHRLPVTPQCSGLHIYRMHERFPVQFQEWIEIPEGVLWGSSIRCKKKKKKPNHKCRSIHCGHPLWLTEQLRKNKCLLTQNNRWTKDYGFSSGKWDGRAVVWQIVEFLLFPKKMALKFMETNLWSHFTAYHTTDVQFVGQH